jgi:hypothetical protein
MIDKYLLLYHQEGFAGSGGAAEVAFVRKCKEGSIGVTIQAYRAELTSHYWSSDPYGEHLAQ